MNEYSFSSIEEQEAHFELTENSALRRIQKMGMACVNCIYDGSDVCSRCDSDSEYREYTDEEILNTPDKRER